MDSLSAWFSQFLSHAMQSGDAARMELWEMWVRGEGIERENHQERLDYYASLKDYALQIGEPWWAAYADFWMGEVWLFGIQNPKKALEISARLVVEARKPSYDGFPLKTAIELNFLACYQWADPVFYAPQLRAALQKMEAEFRSPEDDSLLFHQVKTRFLTFTDDPGALDAAWRHLDTALKDPSFSRGLSAHYVIYAIQDLFQALARLDFAGLQPQLSNLCEWALEMASGEENARLETAFSAWRALERQLNGDAKNARLWSARALRLQERLSPPRQIAYFPLALEREVASDLAGAIRLLEKEIEALDGRGQEFWIGLRQTKIELLKSQK